MNTDILDYMLVESCSKIYKVLGAGHRERTYQNALEYELLKQGLKVVKEYPLRIMYENTIINGYFIDLVINSDLPLELKATKNLGVADEYQIRNYMIQIKSNTGYLINFGMFSLEIIKYVNEKKIDVMEKYSENEKSIKD